MCSKNRYDVVHAHEESAFFARPLKHLFGFKLIYDMHSSLPQQLENFNFTKSRLLIGLFEWLENNCLKNADVVITICPDLADYAVSKMRDTRRHIMIENSIFDEVKLRKGKNGDFTNSSPIFSNSCLDGRPLIVYAGTFEEYQGIEILIHAFQKVHEKRPEAFLLMIGGSPEQVSSFQKLTHDLGLRDHCVFTGSLNQAQTRCLTSRATILTSPRTTGNNVPLKIYEQLASGIPLVATRILSHSQVLSDEVCFLVDPHPDTVAEGLWDALTNKEAREEKVKNAGNLYRGKYSSKIYEEKIARLLEMLR